MIALAVSPCAPPAPAAGLPLAGLLGAWDLTTGAASPIPNLVAGGAAMTLAAAPNNPAITGSGLNFDGTNDYASTDQYPLEAAGTLVAVARTSRAYPSDDAATVYRGIAAKSASGALAGIGYELQWYGSNAGRWLRLAVCNGTLFSQSFYTMNWSGAFHWVAGRWGGGKMSVWSDGVKRHEPDLAHNAQPGLVAPVKLGQSYGTLANCWKDEIAFAAIYDRALSDAEMAQAYKALQALLQPRGISI